jgi:hypothetical protein
VSVRLQPPTGYGEPMTNRRPDDGLPRFPERIDAAALPPDF